MTPKSPAETDEDYASWKEIDALVLQWIYSTISDDLLGRILESDSTARAAWLKIEKIFLSNKKARAAALESKFCNLTLAACSSLDDYCQRLKELANQLGDVDHTVTESRLVLQLVRGLPAEYDTIASLINQQDADWDLARSMLHDEVIRLEARQNTSSSVLVAPAAPTQQTTPNPNQTPDQTSSRGRGRGRGQGYRGSRGGRGRGGGRNQQQANWAFQNSGQNPGYPQWAWWNTPPCPYPTQPSWRPNNNNQSQPNAAQFAPSATQFQQPNDQAQQAHYAGYPPTPQHMQPQPNGYDALNPSDIQAAFATMQLQQPEPFWNMDTGAESHVSPNQGPQNWTNSFAPQ
ncbi:uncharacterized protein LOC110935052 [Helianthus annuus]|uniref:uncharacterized protein LOC110935052 n=1 Tax=Helianthus annuus TaxID=4232 RepID=UPI0016533FEC|nr:uncharacterized protein LOC110935052 [Helianthus annuus]